MPEKYKNSGLLMHELTIKPYSMATIDFLDVKPNYFRVQNFGDTRIYCGTSRTPTENNYDFACKPDGMFMYAEPNTRSFLYIYNPSGNETRVKLVAFAHDFDPLALVFSGIELDFSGTKLEADTAISSFNASLPSGSNTIGGVNVKNWPTDYAKAASQKDYTDVLADLLEVLENEHVVYNYFFSGTASGNETVYDADDKYRWCEIAFLSNDGEGDIVIKTTDTDGRIASMVIKAGEVLNHIPCRSVSVSISGSGAYRLAMVERRE